ncbi:MULTISPECIES: DUF4339 domain-containing protein [Pseudomonadati]|uniref:DUF4339 domain-containing protein n=1 Tax=unclassified Halobacteriovorax TaxID=2639665 RepID=UPI000CD1B98C|nr:DUF4339 domain-containing protein [Halobacteriovorax sp. DA5]POB15387.1 hypothetical protein C0Z22_03070 [Halobacteriovorax sp. DA5]
MQKNWYINQSGKNKGPFNAQDIIDFYDKGLIKSYQLCWRKGAKNWKPVFAVIQVARNEAQSYYESKVLDEDHDLPEIPIHEAKFFDDYNEDDTPPPLEEEIEDEDDFERELEDSSEKLDVAADIKLPSKFPIYTTVIASFIITVVVVISFYMAAGPKVKEVELKNISISALNEFKKPVSANDVHLIVNKDMSALYIKLPFKRRVSVELILHRKPDELHRGDVLVKAHNIGEGGIIEFKDLTLEEGQNFIPGSYAVTFIYDYLGLLDNIKSKFGTGSNREVLEKKVFLVPETREKYIAQITKVEKKKTVASKKNIAAINEKLRTLEALISSMSIHYRLSLSQVSGWLAHKEFKQRYAKNIAPLLQSIILSNYDLNDARLSSEERKLENEIHSLGKDISAWSVKLTDKLSRYGMLNKKKRLYLRKFMDDDRVIFQSSKNDIQAEIQKLL